MTHTQLSEKQLKQLTTHLNPNRVKALKGMSYLEAFDVKATLIRMFGFGGFSAELIESEIVRAEQIPQANNAQKMNWAITAKAVVKLTIHQTGAVYTEAAIAGSKQPDFTESADMAIKSAESDALKRAAIYLGTQFGLSLYDSGNTQDIVKVVLAPDQVWPPAPPAEAMQDAANGRPSTAAASVAHLRGDGVDDAAHQQNMAHLNSALSAQVSKQEQRGGPDVPVALNSSLDDGSSNAEDEVRGAAAG